MQISLTNIELKKRRLVLDWNVCFRCFILKFFFFKKFLVESNLMYPSPGNETLN